VRVQRPRHCTLISEGAMEVLDLQMIRGWARAEVVIVNRTSGRNDYGRIVLAGEMLLQRRMLLRVTSPYIADHWMMRRKV